MTRTEQATLRAAAELVTAELAAGRDVRIPGFGVFYVKDMRVRMDLNKKEQTHVKGIARFRPFGALKDAVARLQERCAAERTALTPGDKDRCIFRDNHWCAHMDESGKIWS
mgnify:CR=1 FL=1